MFSFIGLYFGLHEALLCLKKRGIVLACVSKNDESVVRELWKYPDSYPRERLLTLDDFVTHRINWNDKVDNIRSIAEELGFAPEAFLFIDDNPVERDRVRQFLPEVEVWGEDLFGLRRALLDDPRLQIARVTDESARRTELVKAQLDRQRLQAEAVDENSYIASLQIRTRIERVTTEASSIASKSCSAAPPSSTPPGACLLCRSCKSLPRRRMRRCSRFMSPIASPITVWSAPPSSRTARSPGS